VGNITGVITDVVSYDKKTHYCTIVLNDGKKYVGKFPFVRDGIEVELKQSGTENAIYDTTPFSEYKVVASNTPQSAMGILKSVNGIGAKKAKQIYEHFGDKLYYILTEETHRLAEVEGIGNKKLQEISEVVDKVLTIEPVVEMFGHILPYRDILSLVSGKDEFEIRDIVLNPYKSVFYLDGLTAERLDSVASISEVIPQDDHYRIAAFVYGRMKSEAAMGKTTLKRKNVENYVYKKAKVEKDLVTSTIDRMKEEDMIIENVADVIKLSFVHKMELDILNDINRLLESKEIDPDGIDELADSWQRNRGIKLSPNQLSAIYALNRGVSCVTGGAGTGKSFIISLMNYIAGYYDIPCFILSPTGAAAKRLERLALKSSTVHRFLGYNSNKCDMNREHQSKQGVYIVDESSMLSYSVMSMLLAAIPDGSSVIFVGDPNQLPPVEIGRPFIDLVHSESVDVFHLTDTFRQDVEAIDIIRAAEGVLRGNLKALNMPKSKSFFIHVVEESEDMVESIKSLLLKERSKREDMRDVGFITEYMIMAPTKHKGYAPVSKLNKMLAKTFNKEDDHVAFKTSDGISVRVYDIVMNTKNDYERNVFNGDTGVVNYTQTGIQVYYTELKQLEEYEPFEVDNLELSYARSVHKSQGSEAKYAIFPIEMSSLYMWNRQMLYTAITRARKEVHIFMKRNEKNKILNSILNTKSDLSTDFKLVLNKLIRKESVKI